VEIAGAVDGSCGRTSGGEERGVVGAFFGGVQVGAFDVSAEERGRVWDLSGSKGGEDLVALSARCGGDVCDVVESRWPG
jgi:hypothetical protein